MTRDEQARQRLVEIALRAVEQPECEACRGQGYVERLYDGMIADYACEECWGLKLDPLCLPNVVRSRAGFKNPRAGHWCAAGLTAAMAQAGLLVPAPGTPARRGAIALLDWVAEQPGATANRVALGKTAAQRALDGAQPGDILAWLQHPRGEWRRKPGDELRHAFSVSENDYRNSLCGEVNYHDTHVAGPGKSCKACAWGTRKGHVAVIVATDSESITTVGWSEGPRPGRVMMRRLLRDGGACAESACLASTGVAGLPCRLGYAPRSSCQWYRPRSSTVLWRRPGGLYGIARSVAA